MLGRLSGQAFTDADGDAPQSSTCPLFIALVVEPDIVPDFCGDMSFLADTFIVNVRWQHSHGVLSTSGFIQILTQRWMI